MQITQERPGDATVIGALTDAAFKDMPHGDETEARIVEALRAAGALTLSIVAIQDGQVIGHVAFSPVRIDGQPGGWYGLGPVSVWPERQRGGIGSAIIRDGLDRLRAMGAEGCVLLGDPAYYRRFGFVSDPGLRYRDVPDGYVQALAFAGELPRGEVTFHPSFDVG